MSTEPTDAPQAEPNPFGKVFTAYAGESGDQCFEIEIESMFTDPAHEDYRKFANLIIRSVDATIAVHLPASLDKGQMMELAQFIRNAGADMEDHE
jgi:hypothetical protein